MSLPGEFILNEESLLQTAGVRPATLQNNRFLRGARGFLEKPISNSVSVPLEFSPALPADFDLRLRGREEKTRSLTSGLAFRMAATSCQV